MDALSLGEMYSSFVSGVVPTVSSGFNFSIAEPIVKFQFLAYGVKN